jgi:hypothetical protein
LQGPQLCLFLGGCEEHGVDLHHLGFIQVVVVELNTGLLYLGLGVT